MKLVAVGLVVVLATTALSLPANGQNFTKFRAFPGPLRGATTLNCTSALSGIAAGPDGAVWFTDQNCNLIGRITTAGVVTTFPIPSPSTNPSAITAGPDGALWFTEFFGSRIGRITTTGAITEFALPTSNLIPLPWSIVLGPDGALWFTEEQGNKIGRITTSGTITEFPIPTNNSAPSVAANNGLVG